MENKINVAELLKDCPTGMELDCTLFDDVYFDSIDEVCDIIKCYIKDSHHKIGISFNKYGHYSNIRKAKCIIFPKGKTTWDGFIPPRKFKDGDIISNDRFIAIFHRIDKPYNCVSSNVVYYHCFLNIKHNEFKAKIDYGIGYIEEYKYATEKEKQKLFDAIKDNGYRWNPETKTLEKLIERKFKVGDIIKYIYFDRTVAKVVKIHNKSYELDNGKFIEFQHENAYELSPDKFDINTLKPFDKVLVRDSGEKWCINLFGCYNKTDNQYNCIGNTDIGWDECIPYEENKHLLNTTNNCDNYYKTWE